MEPAMHLRQLTTSLVSLAAVAGVVAGCGGSDAKPASAHSSGLAAHANSGHALTISGFKFTPSSLETTRGARITVKNDDSTAHTATADDGSFDTSAIAPGAAATVTQSKAGTYKFHCSIHPFMHGTLVVR
jgi:plastocyanin